MNVVCISTLAACLCFSATSYAAEMVTGAELIRRQQSAPTAAIVKHCEATAPEASQAVKEGHKIFLSSLDAALAIWRAEKPGTQEQLEQSIPNDAPEVLEMEAAVRDIGGQMLQAVQKYDPHQYCPWFAGNMKASTPESVLKSLHEYDARVEKKQRENNDAPVR